MSDAISLLGSGLVLGFSIAAPVGPIGVLCIRRTLVNGGLTGFISGMGAASADAFYGVVAAFGLTFISNFLISFQGILGLVGGLFLLYLGVKTLLSRPAENEAKTNSESRGLIGAYTSILFLTITNPMTILSFVAFFTGAGLIESDRSLAGVMVLGVFLGSAAWWLLLSTGVSILRSRFDSRMMLWVNRLSGMIIIGFALMLLVGQITS